MNKTFTTDGRTFKQVKSNTGCLFCAGMEVDENVDWCDKISNYVADRNYRSCQKGFVYVEVEK